jgi:hypothetical protein
MSLAEEEYAWKDYQVNFSGEVSSANVLTTTLSTTFSGAFYPVITGQPIALDSSFTGKVTGSPIDNPTYSIGFTGAVASGNIDAPTYSLDISGEVTNYFTDAPAYFASMSGSQVSGMGENPTYSVRISGNIVKYNRDQISLTAAVDYITWDKGNFLVEEEYAITGTLTCSIDFIGWSLGGV